VGCRNFRHLCYIRDIELMFLNQYQHSFDDKGRLTIPSKFRELPPEGAFVVQGLDRNLMVLPQPVFQNIYDHLMTMNLTDPTARLLRRIILGNALPVIPDGAGRILLTPNLKEYANLNDSVVFVGQGDYFEIWSPDLWKMQEEQVNDAETNAQRFATLDLKMR
jgi:MraZ protein